MDKWNRYFHDIANAVASNSSCMSRKIGAIIVKDKSILATGYNGPARGIPKCNERDIYKDGNIILIADQAASLPGSKEPDSFIKAKAPVFSLADNEHLRLRRLPH